MCPNEGFSSLTNVSPEATLSYNSRNFAFENSGWLHYILALTKLVTSNDGITYERDTMLRVKTSSNPYLPLSRPATLSQIGDINQPG